MRFNCYFQFQIFYEWKLFWQWNVALYYGFNIHPQSFYLSHSLTHTHTHSLSLSLSLSLSHTHTYTDNTRTLIIFPLLGNRFETGIIFSIAIQFFRFFFDYTSCQVRTSVRLILVFPEVEAIARPCAIDLSGHSNNT